MQLSLALVLKNCRSFCMESPFGSLQQLSAWLENIQSCPASSQALELCVQVTASPLHLCPWKEHPHCSCYPISNYLLPGPCCSGGTSSPEPFLQSQALPQPHLCKGIHLHQERERESSKSLQVGTAVPSPASEESWSLGKRSGRVITGCIWTSNCRDTPASEVTVGSSVHLVGTQYVPCFYKYKDI